MNVDSKWLKSAFQVQYNILYFKWILFLLSLFELQVFVRYKESATQLSLYRSWLRSQAPAIEQFLTSPFFCRLLRSFPAYYWILKNLSVLSRIRVASGFEHSKFNITHSPKNICSYNLVWTPCPWLAITLFYPVGYLSHVLLWIQTAENLPKSHIHNPHHEGSQTAYYVFSWSGWPSAANSLDFESS